MARQKKPMDTMEWLSLAVYQDIDRENLTGIWGEDGALVSTDGHRMHVAHGVSGKGWVDGIDRGQFPDWRQVIPSKVSTRGIFSVASLDEKALKALALCAKLHPKEGVRVGVRTVVVEGGHDFCELYFVAKHPELTVEGKLSAHVTKTSSPWSAILNPKYLLEALKMGGTIEISSGTDSDSVVVIRNDCGREAYVMSMRER